MPIHYMQSINQASTSKLISLWVIMGWERREQAKAKQSKGWKSSPWEGDGFVIGKMISH